MPVELNAHPTEFEVATLANAPEGGDFRLLGDQHEMAPAALRAQNAMPAELTFVNVPLGGVPRSWPVWVWHWIVPLDRIPQSVSFPASMY